MEAIWILDTSLTNPMRLVNRVNRTKKTVKHADRAGGKDKKNETHVRCCDDNVCVRRFLETIEVRVRDKNFAGQTTK